MVGILKSLLMCIPPSLRARLHITAVEVTFSPFEIEYSIQYIIHHIFPPPGNPQIPTFLVYEYFNIKHLYDSIAYVSVLIAGFVSSKIYSYLMLFLVNNRIIVSSNRPPAK